MAYGHGSDGKFVQVSCRICGQYGHGGNGKRCPKRIKEAK